MKDAIHLTLESRICAGHYESDIIIKRPGQKARTYTMTNASADRINKIIPEWYVDMNGMDGIEVWQVWRKPGGGETITMIGEIDGIEKISNMAVLTYNVWLKEIIDSAVQSDCRNCGSVAHVLIDGRWRCVVCGAKEVGGYE